MFTFAYCGGVRFTSIMILPPLMIYPPCCDRPADQSASDRREELGQGEAGAAGEVQPGESSVGAETEGGHCTTGEGKRSRVCVCVSTQEVEMSEMSSR